MDRSRPPGRPKRTEEPARQPVSFPVSFAQQRVWFLHYLQPDFSSYNLPVALRLTGPLDVAALEDGLNEIVKRHDALRTIFPVYEGRPVQVVLPVRQIGLSESDLRELPAAAREGEASRLASVEGGRPFDLAQGPLFRAKLLSLGEEDHVLVVTMHHIVSDGWSIGILMRELAALYEAFRLGKPSPLPELPIQYADYSLWQQKWLRDDTLEAQLDYWRKQLDGLPTLALPTDRPRTTAPSVRGASLSAVPPPGLFQKLDALARREGATLFMTLLAAFQALLSRYSGQEDIPVGSPIAGRTQVETETLIGFFVNTLVMRGDLSGDPSFRQLLARVRETALDAYAHQDLPFEKLVEKLQPVRSPTQTPLFQVLFQLATSPRENPEFPGLEVGPFQVRTESAKFDLSLHVIARQERLSSVIEYRTDLFDAETIRRMLGHWEILLAGIARDPDRPISEIPLIGDAERQQILVDWNATERVYPREKSVAEVFESQAAATPAAVALVLGTEQLTYADLNARANRLARFLRGHGVGAEAPVGVFLDRSFDMVVALLAILKAGGAYVPLDPFYPRERLGFLIRDTGMRILLTESARAGGIPAAECVSILCLDSEALAIGRQTGENLSSNASSDSIAYVMYTSGSTGTPKGVLVPHRGILRLVRGVEYVRIGSEEVFLQLAPVSFDASTFELWGALLNGARCVLFPARVPTPAELRAVIAKHGVSILWLTASLFNAIVDADAAVLSGVRQLLIGGEALSAAHVRRALEALPSTQIINGYGPTESTTFACCYRIPAPLPESEHSIPIGTPISNTRLYILDRKRSPAPIGVRGELYIGGDGLARGYLNNPELTAEKFIPDAFSGDSGGRLYRTGDLARYRPDGKIEFLGRLDDQLKIRGFRVEPGEIEATLRQHPALSSAIVVAREDLPGDRRLAAYVVRRDRTRDPVPDLRGFLAAKLPEYMVPSAFVVLDSLPLSASGKLDWRALPRPGLERVELGSGGSLPKDTLELVLLMIWEEVLGVRAIRVGDDFFELGGHSLLAVRLFAEIEKAFGRNLPLATLFQAPTVERLAAKLREDGWEAPWSSLVVIQGGAKNQPPFLCVPGVGGNILGFYDLARQLGPDQPVYGLQAKGLDGKGQPLTRIEDMAAHYLREIRAVLPEGPFLLGGASFGGSVAFEMARQLEAAGETVALVALFDAFAPGTSTSLPLSSKLHRRFKNYGAKLVRHGRNVLFGSDRSNYIKSRSRTLRRRIRSRIWQTVYGFYRSRSGPLPRVLQDVREAGYLANKEYIPGPYRGKVTLFRAGVRSIGDSPSHDMGWDRLAHGGVEIREVPGDHVNMLLRPQVGLLAEQLRDCIDRAIRKESERAQPEKPHSTEMQRA